MQKNRCTALFGWMGDATAFIRPVKIFPSVETILKLDPAGHLAYKRLLSLQMICPVSLGRARRIAIASCTHMAMAVALFAAPEQTANAATQIRSVLKAQQDAWNRGDIDGFMNGYARSASTVFISEDTIRRGWQTVRDRYKQKYSNRAKMGTLMFSGVEITLLSSDSAVASGRWRLKRANDQPHGRFTLILKRLPEGWRIVHDHTSAAGRKS
jgi:ketosteroid isomerase-like protein